MFMSLQIEPFAETLQIGKRRRRGGGYTHLLQIGKFFCIGLLDFGKTVCDEIKIIRRNEFGKNLTKKN